MSDELFDGLYAKLWHMSAKMVGGILESITRLWLTQRATVHPLNAPSATTVGPKAQSCQPVSTHAWWWVTLKAKGPVTPLQPLSGRLDEVNLWAHTTDTWMLVCINSGKQRGFFQHVNTWAFFRVTSEVIVYEYLLYLSQWGLSLDLSYIFYLISYWFKTNSVLRA